MTSVEPSSFMGYHGEIDSSEFGSDITDADKKLKLLTLRVMVEAFDEVFSEDVLQRIARATLQARSS